MGMFDGVGSAIGTAIGGYFGGPSGAAAGAEAGGWVDDAFSGGSSSPAQPDLSNVSEKQSLSQPVPPIPSASSLSTGVSSTMQGSNPPPPGATPQPTLSGSQAARPEPSFMASTAHNLVSGLLTSGGDEVKNKLMQSLFHKNDAAEAGANTRKYLANAFPELNPWERSGAGGTMSGIQEQQFGQQKQLTQMQLNNQKDIAKMQMDNQLKIAGIGSVTSRQNTRDTVYANNEMLDNNKRESSARINSILANTELSRTQKAAAIANITKTYAETGQIPHQNAEIDSRIRSNDANTSNSKGAKTFVGKAWSDFKANSDSSPTDAFHILFPHFDDSPIGHVYHKTADMFHHAEGVQGSMSRK